MAGCMASGWSTSKIPHTDRPFVRCHHCCASCDIYSQPCSLVWRARKQNVPEILQSWWLDQSTEEQSTRLFSLKHFCFRNHAQSWLNVDALFPVHAQFKSGTKLEFLPGNLWKAPVESRRQNALKITEANYALLEVAQVCVFKAQADKKDSTLIGRWGPMTSTVTAEEIRLIYFNGTFHS